MQTLALILSIALGFVLVGLIASVFLRAQRAQRAQASLLKEKGTLQEELAYLRFRLQRTETAIAAPEGMLSRWEGEEIADPLTAKIDSSITPHVPEELVNQCALGHCVFYGGAALTVQAGYPTRRELVSEVLGGVLDGGRDAHYESILAALEAGRLDQVTEFIVARGRRDALVRQVRHLYGGDAHGVPPYSNSLAAIRFAGAITGNWDNLLERVFWERNPTRVLAPDADRAAQFLKDDVFAITKLWGDADDEESVILTNDEFRRGVANSSTFAKYLTSVALSKSLLFVGASLRTVESFFSTLNISQAGSRPHYALVADEPDLELNAEVLLAKYGLHLLSVPSLPVSSQVSAFLEELRQRVNDKLSTSPPAALRPATLTEVRLSNIGPFRDLSLKLQPGWNVILGNNGTGKSTILRAIALALCGDDPRALPAAQRLLNVRAEPRRGSIELLIGEDRFLTDLEEEGGSVITICRQLTPLRTGTLVALGFPPVRGLSMRQSRGPSPDGMTQPSVDDVLPVASGDVDWRLDSLRQWVINVDARSTPSDTVSEDEAERSRQLLKTFFEILDDFTPGVDVRYKHVDKLRWQVLVETDDGPVPIQQVSQGMASIFGWVGTLLQRMYEMYPSALSPEREAAVVLIDEIDAHLHPIWQQALVPLLRDRFPNIQVIATTHSPLLIAGLERGEVWIARRDETDRSSIVLEAPATDVDGMKADQILTSPLFGLSHTRNQRTVNEYAALRGKGDSRTPAEQSRFVELDQRFKTILLDAEDAVGKSVEQAVERTLREMSESKTLFVADTSLSVEAQLELKRQLAEVFGGIGDRR